MKPQARNPRNMMGDNEPLLPPTPGSSAFVHGKRNRTDNAWLAAWLSVLVLAVVGGIYGITHRNPAFLDLVNPSTLNDPAACPAVSHARGLKQTSPTPTTAYDTLMSHSAGWTAGTLLGSLGLGLGFVALLKHSAQGLVATAIGLQVGLPLGAALSFFLAGSVAGGFAMLGVAGLLGVLFVMYKEQIDLVTRLLGVAGHALVECSGLVGLAVGLQLALLLVVVPLVTMGVAAFTNGHLIFNPARSMTSPEQPNALDGLGGSGLGPLAKKGDVPELQCTNLSGDKVLCCTWEPEPWVPFYMALLSLALSWTTFLLFEVKVFTVAGTVAQWYFAPVSGPGGMTGGVSGRSPRSSRVGTSLSHALGPQLGSLCFSSAVLTLVSYLRQMLEKARREQGNNLLFCIFAYFANLFYTLIEFCTKFATVQMALTGQAFMPAAHSVVDLLRRNFLDAFGVWWLPPLILQNCAFLAAATFGGGMWAAGYASLGGFSSAPAPAPGPEGEAAAASPMAVAVMLAIIAFLCAWVVLAFFCALLLNVVDAVFLCFALDRDMRTCTRVEVHQVYCCLPTVGPVVEQPDGDVAYGRPPQPATV
ncbi:plasma-membrane choline transporter-domain-containing protein [Haematococcus lacustris]